MQPGPDPDIPGVFRLSDPDPDPLPEPTRLPLEWDGLGWIEWDPQTGRIVNNFTCNM